jgi:tRNA dimethylallyltransferase
VPPETPPVAPSPAARAAIWLVRGYKRFLSRPFHLVFGPWCGCRFTPTCSEYARQAFATHGFWRGGWLALRRLLRCNPLFAGGVDEVPRKVGGAPAGGAPSARATLTVITGVTAVGKTAFAVERALATNAEIVSCDSLLVYRGLDIGTAKPTAAERAAVRHHCVDIAEPDAPFSVRDYIAAARAAIGDILSRGKNVIVTGGSGFYLKAFFAPVTDDVAVPPEVAERVRAIAATGGLDALTAALLPFAPDRPAFLDWANPRRVAKALERCLAAGRPLAELHAEFLRRPAPFADFATRAILLERDPADLAARIERRVAAMLAAGLVDEVRTLRDAGKLPAGSPAGSAVGYRETLAWLERTGGGSGQWSVASGQWTVASGQWTVGSGREAVGGGQDIAGLAAEIALHTRQLAAKQRKWFRTQITADEVVRL